MSVPIQIVDEHDVPLRAAPKEEAWRDGLYHRIVRIMVEDGQGNVLLQKRGAQQQLFPGCWDNSAAGHVDAGEDYETAARRELSEELGLTDVSLEPVAYYKTQGEYMSKHLNRFNTIYRAQISRDAPLQLHEGEVADAQWFSGAELHTLVTERSDEITDGLVEAYERLYA